VNRIPGREREKSCTSHSELYNWGSQIEVEPRRNESSSKLERKGVKDANSVGIQRYGEFTYHSHNTGGAGPRLGKGAGAEDMRRTRKKNYGRRGAGAEGNGTGKHKKLLPCFENLKRRARDTRLVSETVRARGKEKL